MLLNPCPERHYLYMARFFQIPAYTYVKPLYMSTINALHLALLELEYKVF